MHGLVLLVAATVLLAGCLEAGPEQASGAGNEGNATATGEADEALAPAAIAFHLFAPCDACVNLSPDDGRAYLFLADGTVLRAELARLGPSARDGSVAAEWEPVLNALDVLGHTDVAPVDARRWELSTAASDGLRAALAGPWVEPTVFEETGGGPCERPCPTVLGRADNGGWSMLPMLRTVDHDHPDNAPFTALLRAFLEAEPLPTRPKPIPPEPTPAEATNATANATTATNVTAYPTEGAGADWQGQDSEFGAIRALFRVAIPNGSRASLEARVVLRETYAEQDTRFFMFKWTVESTPLDVAFDRLLRMDTGQELPCYQRQGSPTTGISCFVERDDMPPAGTEVRMIGSVGAAQGGVHQAGALVVPFTSNWARVQMSNGLDAELYAGTQVDAGEVPTRSMP